MRIATNHDKTVRETTNQTEITALVRFITTRKDDWCQPWYGTPVGLMRAELYSDKKFLGTVSLGSNFMGNGMWRVRTIKESDRQDLLLIFAVDDPYPAQGM